MELESLAAIAIAAASLAVILRRYAPEQSLAVSLAAGTVLMIVIVTRAAPVFQTIRTYLDQSGMPGEYVQIIFKALGACLITQLASDICRDAGETAIASRMDFAGRVTLLLIGLPLFQKITETALTLIG